MDLSVLDPENNEGYGNWPLPCHRDGELRDLVTTLTAQRERPADAHAPVVRAFAERMATLARREASVDQLRSGLDAAALVSLAGDVREGLLILPLLWRTAAALGLDAGSEFRAAAERVGGGGPLLEFAARKPEDQTLEAMGYVEVEDEFGVHYERTW